MWLRPKRLERWLRQQGLSGNPYRFFHGDLKEIGMMTQKASSKPGTLSDDVVARVQPFHQELIRKHGKKSFLWVGPTPKVTIMEPKLIREVLLNHDIFRKPRTNPLARLLISGILAIEGQQWVHRRKILNPAFHFDKLKFMIPAIQLCTDEMLQQWKMSVMKNGSYELDVWTYVDKLTGDIISRTAFGSSYEEGRKLFQLQREQGDFVAKFLRSPYIPGWRFIPTKANKRMKQIYCEVESTVKGIIDKKEKAMKAGESSNDDLLGIMMESNLKEIQEHKTGGMSLHDVIEECKVFYLAGQETTRNLLVWTIILLAKHQDWQSRARDEVMKVFGENNPDYNGLSHLKVVTMILYEVLRLYPPVVELTRAIIKETTLGELYLPKGVLVGLPILLVHHDPDIWGADAEEFNPERFSQGVVKATNNQLAAFNPFSMGPRICMGQNFALIEAKVALSMMLKRFSFDLSPLYAHAPRHHLTLKPQHGARVSLRTI